MCGKRPVVTNCCQLLAAASLLAGWLRADLPLPERLLNPRSPAEAWNVLRLALDNSARLVQEKRAEEVAGHIVLCSPALRLLAAHGAPFEHKTLADAQSALAFSMVNLIARASMAGNLTAVDDALTRLRTALEALSQAYEADWTRSEIFACPDHPENVAESAGGACPQCQRPLVARRVPYSFVYVEQTQPALRVEAVADAPLQAGKKTAITLKLSHANGTPAAPSDLLVNHASTLHLLLCDATLQDFHHVVPVAGQTPGEYRAEFTPARAGSYHLWTGVVPAGTALQEYHLTQLPSVVGDPGPVGLENQKTSVEVGGFRFHLSFHQAMQARAGRTQLMRIEVTEAANGEPVKRLEPFLNAFSHVTAIHPDRAEVFQLHPAGGDILREDLRGGPYLAFKFFAPRPSLLRIFCEVKIDGRRIVAPLAIKIAE